MILARTLKGKGVSLFEGKPGWHGKALKKGSELDGRLAELQAQLVPEDEPLPPIAKPATQSRAAVADAPASRPPFKLGEEVATREAFGDAVGSTRGCRFAHRRARCRCEELDRSPRSSRNSFRIAFYEVFIAEQVMVGARWVLPRAARFRFLPRSARSSPAPPTSSGWRRSAS
jgi:transketolase